MAENVEEEEDLKQKSSAFRLFPAASQETVTNKQSHSLFASASAGVSTLQVSSKTDLSWLTNKSYTKDTEKKLVEFQEELQDYKNKLSGDGQGSDDEQEDDVHDSDRDDRKRQYISSDDSSGERRERKKKKKKHKKKHKKEKYKDLELEKELRHQEKSEVFSKTKLFLEELGDISQPAAYRLDHHADQNSWTYGSLYKPHIARYKHFSPICLGSGQKVSVLLYDAKKSNKHKPWDNRYFGKDNRAFIKIIGEQLTNVIPEGALTDSYVELKAANEEVGKMAVDVRQRILDESTSAYIKGQAGKELYHVNIQEETVIKGPLERKVEEFNKRLREEPHNVKLWLDFLKFQDVLFSEGSFGDDHTKEKEKLKAGSRALLDKKLSILDRALDSNPASIELQLKKLEMCSDIWDFSKINKELEQLLFVHPANTELWQYYLMFNQSRVSVFTVSKMIKLYHKCFKTLFGILEGKVQTHSVPEDLQDKTLGIFYRYCLFLRNSGYKEKALTSIQSLIEFNLFCPPSLKSVARETKMAAFEDYWDSGCAKLGFPGAQGWKSWAEQKGKTTTHSKYAEESLEELEETIIEQKLPKPNTWLQIEALREAHHWLPWQPDVSDGETEENCEDPERLVMFDDISPVMFTVPENHHLQLVIFFLLFSGLSMVKSYIVRVKQCCKMFILCSGLSDVLVSVDMFPSSESSLMMPEQFRNFVTSVLQLLVPVFKAHERTLLTLILIELHIQMIFQGRKELSKSDKKEVRKTVKSILKEEHNRNNMAVWLAFVTVEMLIGKPGEADAILETALSVHSGKDIAVVNEETLGLVSLYRMYCETILKIPSAAVRALWERQTPVSKESKQKIVQVLWCAVENRTCITSKLECLTAIAQLKMKSKFKKLIEAAVYSLSKISATTFCRIECKYFLEVCMCSCFYEYCSGGLETGLAVYQSARNLLQTIQTSKHCEKHVEQLQVDIFREEIRLILYHMTTLSTPLSILRNCLDTALSHHPSEADFLQLFVDIEKQSRIAGRLHRYVDKLLHNLPSPELAIVAISSQLEYLDRIQQTRGSEADGVSKSGIVNKTRSWLERCLGQSNVQHCQVLWKLYFTLEKRYGDAFRLKGIFYRSIQQCPWVKDLYLEGVQMFGDQLQELVDMMMEKEIRVQIPVEELDILISD